ncbi:MAG: DUF3443 family protein [Nitrospiria bacterium]
MKSCQLSLFFLILLTAGCGNTNDAQVLPPNVLSVKVEAVGTGVCSSGPNTPCTQVTICQPGTSNCQTISDILVDTGSSGLRIFQSLLTIGLPQTSTSLYPIAECVQFGDLSAAWGPIEFADVILGGELAPSVPIQVIFNPDTNTNSPPATTTAFQSACPGTIYPLDTPVNSGLNGILGVSFYQVDTSGNYFACGDSGCSTNAPTLLSNQFSVGVTSPVLNPVFSLPVDNNGVILSFPGVPASGATSVAGSLILGIGTQANNMLSSQANIYPAVSGAITTSYNGSTNAGYFDSGSNLLAVPDTTITACTSTSGFYGFYCQAATRTAFNLDVIGSLVPVIFQIADASSLNFNLNVFNNLGGPLTPTPNMGFDWGFPFFLGRTVYVGYGSAPGTVGPYFAY